MVIYVVSDDDAVRGKPVDLCRQGRSADSACYLVQAGLCVVVCTSRLVDGGAVQEGGMRYCKERKSAPQVSAYRTPNSSGVKSGQEQKVEEEDNLFGLIDWSAGE
jgi:hypothetical protein